MKWAPEATGGRSKSLAPRTPETQISAISAFGALHYHDLQDQQDEAFPLACQHFLPFPLATTGDEADPGPDPPALFYTRSDNTGPPLTQTLYRIQKMDPPPHMNPLLHWGNCGIIRGFHFLDPLGGLGNGDHSRGLNLKVLERRAFITQGSKPVSFRLQTL